ncbi:MAG: phosphate acyltransferase PlsX [Chlorobi bacterium]|nr:phosphate acyltransferase PlsX [Chlorobiota bacterium]MBX7217072.1 phosphate acyltransferase PlsX [Candidatus Kapabacteria bacterium]
MSNSPVRIAFDAMGTDRAPSEDVRGAIDALQEMRQRGRDFTLTLVGRQAELEAELAKFPAVDRSRIAIANATEVIAMDDEPAQAVRSKRDSSIVRGLTLHREGQADAFVSAGNTGAVMAASTFILGRIPGIARPTIASQFPSANGYTIVADVGANVDTKPRNLYEFAVMTSVYAESIFGYPRPTVGLLNVGEEEGKGEERAVQAYELLKSSSLNFVGNVEGRDILKGTVRVVICDGFTGNIILKFAESVPGLLRAKLTNYANSGFLKKLMTGLSKGVLKGVFREMDYQEYGGVPLLGVNGVSIIGHGGSTAKAIKNMIFKAEEMVRKEVNQKIAAAIGNAAKQ